MLTTLRGAGAGGVEVLNKPDEEGGGRLSHALTCLCLSLSVSSHFSLSLQPSLSHIHAHTHYTPTPSATRALLEKLRGEGGVEVLDKPDGEGRRPLLFAAGEPPTVGTFALPYIRLIDFCITLGFRVIKEKRHASERQLHAGLQHLAVSQSIWAHKLGDFTDVPVFVRCGQRTEQGTGLMRVGY